LALGVRRFTRSESISVLGVGGGFTGELFMSEAGRFCDCSERLEDFRFLLLIDISEDIVFSEVGILFNKFFVIETIETRSREE